MQHWWQDKVIYQIYPKSFKDTDGDGLGDLQGVISKLDYLENLGIGGIWLSPVFKSPQVDNGYDVSDYEDIDPIFGTMEDMQELIEKADEHNIKIILDLVLNHTSDQHRWFQEALKGPENKYFDYYIWREEPNGIVSSFGGTAWTYVEDLGLYYYHHYAPEQPDLNWENEDMRHDIYKMINNWIDRGVGGFRLDVIDELAKDIDNEEIIRYPQIHDIIRELSHYCFQGKDILTVGETWSANIEEAKNWSNPDGSELSMVFQFEHSLLDQEDGKSKFDLVPLDLMDLKEVLSRWQTDLKDEGWNSLFFENHDLPRIVSRWGNDQEYREQSAKMFATLIHGMQGTPYIYQGQELGMTNPHWRDINKYEDVESINLYNERLEAGYTEAEIYDSLEAKSRDNARTPMQWDDSKHAGFTDGEPWIDLNSNYKEINAKDQVDDENSVYNHYKQLVNLRKGSKLLVYGDYELILADDPEVFAYKRSLDDEELIVICNFYEHTLDRDIEKLLDGHELIVESYEDLEDTNVLRPYESRMYYKKA